jgi:hypothetical protein
MNNKTSFLFELADLLDKYNVALCSSTHDSEVLFIFDEGNFHSGLEPKRYELRTSRHHSTGYEVRIIAHQEGANQ